MGIMEQLKKPVVSIYGAGKNRFAFVSSRLGYSAAVDIVDGGGSSDGDTILFGYAASRQDAIDQAIAYLGHDRFDAPHSSLARYWHEKQIEAKRAERTKRAPKQAKGSHINAKIEYMYTYRESSDGQGGDYISVHVVTKVTPQYIFVETIGCAEWTPENGITGMRRGAACRDRRYRFDRAEAERNGYAKRPEWYIPAFYLDPHVLYNERQATKLPPCARALGLRPRFTVEQVKAAYRQLAKQYHPDAGGDAQQFVELQRNYEQAVKMAATT